MAATARSRLWRRIGYVAVAALLLAVALVAVVLGPLLLAPNEYAGTPSIERSQAYRDPAMMRLAWSMPVASRYRQHVFEFQHNQSVCGPTSIADVLHSVGQTQNQEQVLAGSSKRTWFGYLLGGLTLDQVGDLLARQSGDQVIILRNLDLAQFRATMSLQNDPHHRIIANFHRGPLFGRGHGHFSPLLAYLPRQDLVLVGDVNSNYRPFLVQTARLWKAINTVDPDTGKTRGLAILTL